MQPAGVQQMQGSEVDLSNMATAFDMFKKRKHTQGTPLVDSRLENAFNTFKKQKNEKQKNENYQNAYRRFVEIRAQKRSVNNNDTVHDPLDQPDTGTNILSSAYRKFVDVVRDVGSRVMGELESAERYGDPMEIIRVLTNNVSALSADNVMLRLGMSAHQLSEGAQLMKQLLSDEFRKQLQQDIQHSVDEASRGAVKQGLRKAYHRVQDSIAQETNELNRRVQQVELLRNNEICMVAKQIQAEQQIWQKEMEEYKTKVATLMSKYKKNVQDANERVGELEAKLKALPPAPAPAVLHENTANSFALRDEGVNAEMAVLKQQLQQQSENLSIQAEQRVKTDQEARILEEELKNLRQQFQLKEAFVQQLQKQQKYAETMYQEILAKTEAANKQVLRHDELLTAAKTKLTDATSTRDALLAQMSAAFGDAYNMGMHVQQDAGMQDLQARLNNANANKSELEKKQVLMEAERASQAQLRDELQAEKTQLETKLSELQAGKILQDGELQRMRYDLTTLRETHDAAQTKADEAERLHELRKGELSNTNEELRRTKEILKSVNAELNETHQRLGIKGILHGQILKAKQDVATATQALEQFTQDIKRREAQLTTDTEKLNTDRQWIKGRSDELASQERSVVEKETHAMGEKARLESMQTEIARQQEEITRQQADIALQQTNLGNQQSQQNELNALIDTARSDLSAAQATLRDRNTEITRLHAENEQLLKDADTSSTQLAYKASRIAAVKEQLKDKKEEAERAQLQVDALKTAVIELENRVAQLTEDLKRANEKVKKSEQSYNEVRSCMARTRKSNEKYVGQLKDAEDSITALKEEVAAAKQSLEVAQNEHATAANLMSDTVVIPSENVVRAETNFAALEAELAAAHSTNAELISKGNSAIAEKHNELSAIQAANTVLVEKNMRLQTLMQLNNESVHGLLYDVAQSFISMHSKLRGELAKSYDEYRHHQEYKLPAREGAVNLIEYQQIIVDMKAEIGNMLTTLANMHQTSANIHVQYATHLSQLQQQHQNAIDAIQKERETEIKDNAKRIQDLQTENDELNRFKVKEDGLESYGTRVSDDADELMKAAREAMAHAETVEATNAETHQKMRSEFDTLQAQQATLDAQHVTIEQLRAAIRDNRTQFDEDLRVAGEKTRNAEERVKISEDTIDDLEKTNSRLEQKLRELEQSSTTSIGLLQSQNDVLQNKLRQHNIAQAVDATMSAVSATSGLLGRLAGGVATTVTNTVNGAFALVTAPTIPTDTQIEMLQNQLRNVTVQQGMMVTALKNEIDALKNEIAAKDQQLEGLKGHNEARQQFESESLQQPDTTSFRSAKRLATEDRAASEVNDQQRSEVRDLNNQVRDLNNQLRIMRDLNNNQQRITVEGHAAPLQSIPAASNSSQVQAETLELTVMNKNLISRNTELTTEIANVKKELNNAKASYIALDKTAGATVYDLSLRLHQLNKAATTITNMEAWKDGMISEIAYLVKEVKGGTMNNNLIPGMNHSLYKILIKMFNPRMELRDDATAISEAKLKALWTIQNEPESKWKSKSVTEITKWINEKIGTNYNIFLSDAVKIQLTAAYKHFEVTDKIDVLSSHIGPGTISAWQSGPSPKRFSEMSDFDTVHSAVNTVANPTAPIDNDDSMGAIPSPSATTPQADIRYRILRSGTRVVQ